MGLRCALKQPPGAPKSARPFTGDMSVHSACSSLAAAGGVNNATLKFGERAGRVIPL